MGLSKRMPVRVPSHDPQKSQPRKLESVHRFRSRRVFDSWDVTVLWESRDRTFIVWPRLRKLGIRGAEGTNKHRWSFMKSLARFLELDPRLEELALEDSWLPRRSRRNSFWHRMHCGIYDILLGLPVIPL